MYSVQSFTDVKNTELRRRIVNVVFVEPFQDEIFNEGTGLTETVDRTRTRSQEFQFRIDEDIETIKKIVTAFKNELNLVTSPITGDIDDFTPPVDPTPTQAKLDKAEWELDVAKLKRAQELIDCGVTFSAPQLTAIANLRSKIATNFNASYLG